MARLRFRITMGVAGFEAKTPEGKLMMEAFERKAPDLLKDAMNAARRGVRKASPIRTKKLKRSFRVLKARGRRRPGVTFIAGNQIRSGAAARLFYASLSQRRGTEAADWFDNAVNEFLESDDFTDWYEENVKLFANVILEEYRARVAASTIKTLLAKIPGARILPGRRGVEMTLRI